MTGEDLRIHLEDVYETELSRLGSSKALYAITAGEMDTESVLAGLAELVNTATNTFEHWEGTDATPDVVESIIEQTRDQTRQISDASDQDAPVDSPTVFDDFLRDLDDPGGQLAGLLAWTMVQERTYSQAVGFFVGNADRTAADLFRDLRDGIGAMNDVVYDHLEEVCASEADWEHAASVAGTAIEKAYDHYVDVLEGMGIKVKPVC